MDNYAPRPPRPPLRSDTGNSAFSRISTVADFTDLHSFPDASAGEAPPPARPPLWTLQTSVDPSAGHDDHGHVYASPAAGGARPPAPGYDAVAEEDGAGLALAKEEVVPAADSESEKRSSTGRIASFPMFDLTNMLGPTTQADHDFWRAVQEQEARGNLTGGLGTGIKTDATVTESALRAWNPEHARDHHRPLSRTFSLRGRPTSRIDEVKRLAQIEANKRGEVIEVVLEDDLPQSGVDIGLVSGHAVPAAAPGKAGATALFFPQPNWKPFSMRWPFLLALVVLSLALAALVEVLYQSSTRQPLVVFRAPAEIPAAQYFAIKFLPMMVAVSYGVLWQMTNFDVMRLEPFYQLSKESGALAAESLNVDYLTQFNLLRPLRALRYRHWAVVVSSVASLLANTLVPTLGAATLFLSPDRETRLRFPDGEKRFLAHPVWARLLTATLCVVAALACVLFYQLQARRSGLLADVKGIAGLAAMATVSHILMDFKDMDVATHQDIHNKLKHRRYFLRNSCLAPEDGPAIAAGGGGGSSSGSSNGNGNNNNDDDDDRYARNHLSANPTPLMLRPLGAVPFLVLVALFTVLLPVVLFTPARALADRAPWLVTAVAVLIKLSWGALETNVRLLEPYYLLSRRHAPPRTLCLDYTTMPFGWVAVRALANGHWLVFAVGLGSVMAEVLTVLVTSLATAEGREFIKILEAGGAAAAAAIHDRETVPSFWVSLALSIATLLYFGIVGAVALVRRGGTVFLPRQPNTIASVLAYIHQSKMLYGFVGTSRLSSAELARRLEELGKTYGLGWFRGRDGMSHCGVDEEELLSEYKVGYDYSMATKPWDEEVVNWL
ncbi:hypothetical protein VTJ83DRAFT_7276 [Remersonia thermophila]|uniref:Spray n=1 Tax=Remersonia thermophila TaxID=72144 RepID=A0ABR4D305_9PEZI